MKVNHVFLVCLLFTSVVHGQTTNCVAPPTGLVSWWRAENNALDAWGANHGSAANPTNYAFGKVGLAFNGMVYVPDAASLRLTNALTIEGWINPSTTAGLGLQTIISKLGARIPLLGLNVSNSYYFGLNGGRLNFSMSTNGTDRLNALLQSTRTVPSNQWTHVAATFGTGMMRLYINGQEDTKTTVGGTIFPCDAQLGIGGIPYPSGDLIPGPSSLFRGSIDEVSVYGRELTEFQIRALYEAGATGKCPPPVTDCTLPLPAGLLGWWRAESNAVDSVSQIEATYSGIQRQSARYTNGISGGAFRIDLRSYFIVPQRPVLDVGASNGFTIEGWINPDELTRAQSFAEWNDGKNIGAGLMIRSNALEGYLTGTATQTFRTVLLQSATGLLRSGSWQHVALTYDKGSGLAKVFLNGASVAQTNLGQFRAVTQAPLYLGFRRSGQFSGDYYHGGLDEFSVYGRALSETEILSLHNAGSAGKCYQTCAHPGLVSWWRAEPDKSVGENVVLDNWDSNNGTSSFAMQYATGKVGQAFNLLQNYVRVPDSASLRFTNAFAIEAWVRPTINPLVLQAIVSKFDPNPPTRLPETTSSFHLGITNGGKLVFRLTANGSPQTNTTLVSIQRIPTNQWTHVVATFGSGTMRLFINGQQDTNRPHAGGIFPGNAALGLGATVSASPTGGATDRLTGLLDEVSLYNRELSEFEVRAIYNADAAGKCLAPPTIVGQPQNQSVPLGDDAKFVVTATGTQPLRYQWYFKQSPLAGATNASLVLEKVRTNQAGPYQVRITNTLGLVWSTGVSLTLTPAPSCTATLPGLISWWPGDGNGSDTMGTNNITFVPVSYATGKVDRAFSFLGRADYRATVPNSPSLNFSNNADFSIEMWIKAGASNTAYANVPLFEKINTISLTTAGGFSLSLNQGRLSFTLGQFGGFIVVPPISQPLTFTSPGPDLRDAFFHHVAVSLKRNATNGGNLYVDGQLVLTFDPTPRNVNLANNSPLYIGGPAIPTTNSYFGGLIDEPAVYGRALSGAEILAIRNAGAAGRCKVRPLIVTQPASQRVTVGSNVTFSVVADGTPKLWYQWMRNGSNVPGATNPTYSIGVTGNGGSYSVLVTNLFGRAVSSNAVLTVNFVPMVASRKVTATEDTPTNIVLSAFDSNFSDPLTFVIVTPPQHGTLGPLVLMPGDASVFARTTYTPAPDYNGPDNFTYKVNDGLVDSAVATVALNITPVNDAPVAQSQSVSLDEDTVAAITLGGFDVDGDALTFASGLPAHGTLSGIPPNLNYQPTTNYFGPDSFTFSVSDGKTNSNVATVSLTVRPVNDAPFASISVSPLVTNVPGMTNWMVLAAVCDDAQVVFDGSGSADVENDPLSFTWLDGTNIVSTGKLATNLLTVGSHEIALQVSDGQAVGTNTAAVEVISAAQGVGIVIVLLHESDLGRRNSQPLIASLKNAAAAFDRCDTKPGVNQLEAFKNKVRAQIEPLNPELAEKLIAAVDQVINAAR